MTNREMQTKMIVQSRLNAPICHDIFWTALFRSSVLCTPVAKEAMAGAIDPVPILARSPPKKVKYGDIALCRPS